LYCREQSPVLNFPSSSAPAIDLDPITEQHEVRMLIVLVSIVMSHVGLKLCDCVSLCNSTCFISAGCSARPDIFVMLWLHSRFFYFLSQHVLEATISTFVSDNRGNGVATFLVSNMTAHYKTH